jgi:hypothetical protein
MAGVVFLAEEAGLDWVALCLDSPVGEGLRRLVFYQQVCAE